MPTAVIEERGEKPLDIYKLKIQSSSTLASEDLDYTPEIRLIGSSNEALRGEQDTMDALEEETFTLETFDRLIRKSYEKGVGFILARVTTKDEEDRQYHSYYSAYQINKVLFRTQPELGLLHRMKAKNPLNNMEIIGDVEYFKIDPKSFERTMKQLHLETKKEEFSRTGSIKTKHRRTLSDSSYINQTFSSRMNQLETIKERNESSHSTIMIGMESAQQAGLGSQDQINVQGHSEAPKRKIQYEAKFFATDDDYLMKTEIREIFKQNAVQPNDYMLFTLFSLDNGQHGPQYAPNGEPLFERGQRRQRTRPPASLSNLFGCINTSPTPSIVNNVTGVLTNLGLGIFSALYIAAAIFFLFFLIPAQWTYLATFLFVLGLTFVLLFFAESDYIRT